MHFFDWRVGMGWGAIGMVVWWVLPILGIIVLVKWLSGNGRQDRQAPLDILKSRYARGEIDQVQFDRMRQEIGSS